MIKTLRIEFDRTKKFIGVSVKGDDNSYFLQTNNLESIINSLDNYLEENDWTGELPYGTSELFYATGFLREHPTQVIYRKEFITYSDFKEDMCHIFDWLFFAIDIEVSPENKKAIMNYWS